MRGDCGAAESEPGDAGLGAVPRMSAAGSGGAAQADGLEVLEGAGDQGRGVVARLQLGGAGQHRQPQLLAARSGASTRISAMRRPAIAASAAETPSTTRQKRSSRSRAGRSSARELRAIVAPIWERMRSPAA